MPGREGPIGAGDAPPGRVAREVREGFLAMLPLWSGAIPVGVAYAVAAREAGIAAPDVQLMSLLVFSAAGQVGAVSSLRAGEPGALVVLTAMALNAQLPLLGLAIARAARPTGEMRLLVAWFLTDGAYAVAAARGSLSAGMLLGAGVSMYAGWNIGTGLGIAAGDLLPDARRTGIDFVVTLSFLAVLVPLLRSRPAATAALIAAAAALGLSPMLPGGAAVLCAGVAGCVAGAWLSRPDAPAETPARANGAKP